MDQKSTKACLNFEFPKCFVRVCMRSAHLLEQILGRTIFKASGQTNKTLTGFF